MSSREGITGTGSLHYPSDPDLLRGVLASEQDGLTAKRVHVTVTKAERCEHGKKLGENFKCEKCAWMFGWEEKK
jgi:hypothetical protein